MFGLFKQLSRASEQADDAVPCVEPIVLQDAPDRRKVSGERVTCKCEFVLPNPDPFMHAKMLVTGVIELNVRGCCVYPDQAMSVEEMKRTVPESKALTVSNFNVRGDDGQKFSLGDVAVRRVRLVCDEQGQGVVLRFANLAERQIDTLIRITDAYSKQD
ncbi:MAG: hypothetical protein V3U65_16670 [Granulosicoccaceae bacterium]